MCVCESPNHPSSKTRSIYVNQKNKTPHKLQLPVSPQSYRFREGPDWDADIWKRIGDMTENTQLLK